jgi:hypothetical protein
MDASQKEVRFDLFCGRCKFSKVEKGEPCDECLENPMREGTEQPLNFKE